jgi:actin-related protein
MFRATEHLLPPPLPQPEPVLEETTTVDSETGEVTTIQTLVPQPAPSPPEPTYDVVEEAAKMPLEVAVACSLLSVSPDRVANLAGSILILGGGGAVEGFGDALRWR